jgi:hypothetical protein
MPAIRTVVYPTRRGAPVPLDGARADSLPDKLLKYVPAEVIAFYAPLYSSLTGETARFIVVGASVVGLLLYLVIRAPAIQRPRPWFYGLALVSFAGWALGTSPVGEQMLGITDPDIPKIALAIVIFLVPAFDEVLTRLGA